MADVNTEQQLDQQAQVFIDENKELLEDPETSSDVLGRVFAHGTKIIQALGQAYQDAVKEELPLAKRYNEAQTDDSLSPKELKKRELPYKRAKKKSAERYASFERFHVFMDEVIDRQETKREQEEAEEQHDSELGHDGTPKKEGDLPQLNIHTEADRAQPNEYPDPPNINKADLEPTPPDPDEAEWYQPYREPPVRKLPWWKRLLGVHQEETPENFKRREINKSLSWWSRLLGINTPPQVMRRIAQSHKGSPGLRESPTTSSQADSDREDYEKLLTWYEQNLEVLEKAVAGKQAGEPGEWSQVIDELLDRMGWCDRHMDTIEGRNADMAGSELVSRREGLASRLSELGE